ncbi:BPL-N domain-containing protein [Streptomyces sp. NPDC051954]|uniref:BPL-N domain-containing protein n=1 Tax=Streptomyces sp. NPDC051954 TaxID=3155524 RepID=UPI00341A1420
MDRRRLFARALPAAAATLLTVACSRAGGARDTAEPLLALVYRGPEACDGCAETGAALLRRAPRRFTVRYVGPSEDVPLTADALADADVYVQPGGNDDLDEAWAGLKGAAGAIRDWTRDGGRYLGFCMGGYLAGRNPGFDLLPGDTDQYITSPGASVHDQRDTVVPVTWKAKRRHMYFQDGPIFRLDHGAEASILATYDNGASAAVVAPFGKGRVGVVGPRTPPGGRHLLVLVQRAEESRRHTF